MREEDKPFVTTRNGLSFNIMPRGRAGWAYIALWTLPAIALAIGFDWVMDGGDRGGVDPLYATVVFVILMAIWAVSMARWMYVRSEVVDVRKLLAEKKANKRGES